MRRPVKNATVFIGGGRITNALLAGLRLASYKLPIVVHDRNPQKLRSLKRQYGVATASNLQEAIDSASLLIIAVRPGSVYELLAEIGQINRPVIATSLAAGVPLARLRKQIGRPAQWARAMPSPACRTRRGLTALAFSPGMSRAARRCVVKLFAAVGSVLELPESKFDAFTVTYSTSHGYHALATLAGAAQRIGLDGRTAFTAAAHALADGILSWREGKVSLAALLHEAATPGGIAATVMNAMDAAGYRAIVEEALRAGLAKANANAKR